MCLTHLPSCVLESDETSKQHEEGQDKSSSGTEGAQLVEPNEGACGTSADEIPGICNE